MNAWKLLVTILVLSPIAGFANDPVSAKLQVLDKPYRFFRANGELHLQNGRLVNFAGLDMNQPYCNVGVSSRGLSYELDGTLSFSSTMEDGTLTHRAIFLYKTSRHYLELNCISYSKELTLQDMNNATGTMAVVTLN